MAPPYQPIVDLIVDQYPDVQAIYLFGSFAAGTQNDTSDIDLALLLPFVQSTQIDVTLWMDTSHKIAEISQKDKIDLINLRDVDTVFANQVITTGKLLYNNDR